MLAFALAGCGTDVLSSEPGPGYLGNGDSVLVDDGKCPAGQVDKVTGPASLTSNRTYTCVKKPSGGLF
jgi:hypothetical protein